jgi:pimeloyl-ACP methyl ester carboxylesterase
MSRMDRAAPQLVGAPTEQSQGGDGDWKKNLSGKLQEAGPCYARLLGSSERCLWHYELLGTPGAAATVVLLPDHLNGAAGLRALASVVARCGYRVLLLDWPEHVHTVEAFIKSLEKLLEVLAAADAVCRSAHFLGVGLGALLALSFAQHCPDLVASLMLAGVLWRRQTLSRLLSPWSLAGRVCAANSLLPRCIFEEPLLESGLLTFASTTERLQMQLLIRERIRQSTRGSLCTRLCLMRSGKDPGTIRLPESRISLITCLPRSWDAVYFASSSGLGRSQNLRWPFTGTKLQHRVLQSPWVQSYEETTPVDGTHAGVLLRRAFCAYWRSWRLGSGDRDSAAHPGHGPDTAAFLLLFPRARRAYLKGAFTNYPFLWSADAFILHVLVHLRRQLDPPQQLLLLQRYRSLPLGHLNTIPEKTDAAPMRPLMHQQTSVSNANAEPNHDTRSSDWNHEDFIRIVSPASATTSWATVYASAGSTTLTDVTQDIWSEDANETEVSSSCESTCSTTSRDVCIMRDALA